MAGLIFSLARATYWIFRGARPLLDYSKHGLSERLPVFIDESRHSRVALIFPRALRTSTSPRRVSFPAPLSARECAQLSRACRICKSMEAPRNLSAYIRNCGALLSVVDVRFSFLQRKAGGASERWVSRVAKTNFAEAFVASMRKTAVNAIRPGN